MLSIQIVILVLLASLFTQDLVSRSVYWIVFPILAVLLIWLRSYQQKPVDIMQSALINVSVLILQLLLVSIWFSVKNKRWVFLTDQLLGWGDILFLFCIATYLSVLNFLFFYVASLIFILGIWLIWQALSGKRMEKIPLAGLQAFLFGLLLMINWWMIPLDITNDDRLLQLLLR